MKKPKPPNSFEEIFELARRAYPGVKRGTDTEFACFKKHHKDWMKALPLLLPAIIEQRKRRPIDAAAGRFVPDWKHFKTWLNNRCWEEEVGVTENEEERALRALRQTEKSDFRTRELYQYYLESKTTKALLDLKEDKAFRHNCGWLIDEILARRQ